MAECKKIKGNALTRCWEFECKKADGTKVIMRINLQNENEAKLEAERRVDEGETGDDCTI